MPPDPHTVDNQLPGPPPSSLAPEEPSMRLLEWSVAFVALLAAVLLTVLR